MDSDEPIMLINQPIGSSASDPNSSYIDGAIFQQELLELDGLGKKRIIIHINSVGGNVMEGYSICSAILKSKTPVDTYNVGIAASMAGAIFMCGRKRVMMDYATLMIHNPFGGTDKKQLSAMRESLVTMISAKCSISREQVAYLCDRESWIGASECLKQGFCTEIEVTQDANQKRMPILAGVQAMWQEADKIYNSLNSNSNLKSSDMENISTAAAKATGISLIANYLDLNVDASENSVLAEVKTRINKEIMARSKAEDDTEEMKKDLEKARASYEDLKKKYDTATATIATAEANAKIETDKIAAQAKADKEKSDADVKKAQDEAKLATVKTMVAGFVGKRIKVEAVAQWEATAMLVGVDEAKALIEGLPVNASAAAASTAVATAGKNDPNTVPASSMGYMAQVQADLRNSKKKTA